MKSSANELAMTQYLFLLVFFVQIRKAFSRSFDLFRFLYQSFALMVWSPLLISATLLH